MRILRDRRITDAINYNRALLERGGLAIVKKTLPTLATASNYCMLVPAASAKKRDSPGDRFENKEC